MDISVILATFNRDAILQKTLDSFTGINIAHLKWEIIVVDNGVRQQTEQLVNAYQSTLPITYLSEKAPGKNSALNKALPLAQGGILVFTDDDIIAQPNWLTELYNGINRNPDFDMFGGTIKPSYPNISVDSRINLSHHSIRDALVITNPEFKEGAIRPGQIWGPNMAIRRKIIDAGFTFNPNIGPNGSDYVMGSETEFLLRAHKAGYKSAFLPAAVVFHQIRENQLCLDWLAGRAFRHGKGDAAKSSIPDCKSWFGAPRYLYKKALIHKLLMLSDRIRHKHHAFFSHFIRYNFIKGQISQYKKRKVGQH
ncbi:glycosyltransferase [Alkalimarinus alittae]|uniref:Glycosyltransferase n=1 Tax=Alkalimarinus alittae TaxID=2961619 RepID=A0ABY6MX15_9ALTE|nr:glycosyltransferase family 2 protein [Alkalimarinus alittae]UZE94366.1 glycosyltransferase [Alkalimarinus alittae]